VSHRIDLRGTGDHRVSTGIRGLDWLIDGGLPSNRAIVVCGSPGTGKTTMGLQFVLQGLHAGEPVVFVAADEKPRHLLEDARCLGWNLEPAIAHGQLALLDASPYFTATRSRPWNRSGIDARQVASDLIEQTRAIGARRLVVDSLTSLVPPDMPRGQAGDYVRSLIRSIEDNLGCTIMLTCRAARSDPQGSCEAARYLASGIIDLRFVRHGAAAIRTLRVRKMRGSRVDLAEHIITIEPLSGLSLVSEALGRRRGVGQTAAVAG
jgi:circadian clock protein KaiC